MPDYIVKMVAEMTLDADNAIDAQEVAVENIDKAEYIKVVSCEIAEEDRDADS